MNTTTRTILTVHHEHCTKVTATYRKL